MDAQIISMEKWREDHKKIYPCAIPAVMAWQVWIGYCNAVTRAWFNAFNPHL